MEGVNPQGPLHSMSHPLFSLCLSCTHAHTMQSSVLKVKGEDHKKRREEKLQALTNDLING